MTLDDMSMLMNGQESPMQPQIDMSIDSELELVVTDEYVAMGDGAPRKLARTYDTISMTRSMEMEMDIMGQVQSNSDSSDAESELEGETVHFTADDEGEYAPSFPGDEGDEELLEALTEDMDFRALLPEGEVEEGDEWKVSAAGLKNIMVPGGDLKLASSSEGAEGGMGMGDAEIGDFQDWFTEDIDGEVVATFSGMKETEDGVSVAVIELTIELANAVDLTEKVRESMADAELPEGAGGSCIEAGRETKKKGKESYRKGAGHKIPYSCRRPRSRGSLTLKGKEERRIFDGSEVECIRGITIQSTKFHN